MSWGPDQGGDDFAGEAGGAEDGARAALSSLGIRWQMFSFVCQRVRFANKRKILVFAHVPPPHHGQSVMVQILLEGLRADGRRIDGQINGLN
jgi:hypothetical protein